MAYEDNEYDCLKCEKKKKCCVDFGLIVSKELVFVCEGIERMDSSRNLILTYNIILNNTSCKTIRCLDIQDTLFGIHELEEHGVKIHINALSCKKSLKILPIFEIVKNGGHLLNVCESFIKACSVCVIQIVIVIPHEDRERCRLLRLENIVIVQGKVSYDKSEYKCKRKLKKIKPIVANSPVFNEKGLVIMT